MRFPPLVAAMLLSSACTAKQPPASEPAPRNTAVPQTRVVRETVTVRDPSLDRRVAQLELRLIEKETQAQELQLRLDDTRDEVVRTMAKLQTLASRAEAASAMAEADVALQSLRSAPGSSEAAETAQGTRLMRQSTGEFNKQNFGGALYLANQAKTIATSGRARLTSGARAGATRPGETAFAVPIRLKATSRGNVRDGPGTTFDVAFSVEAGTELTAFSYTDDWVRISDDGGRSGWIFRSLVGRP